MHFFQKKIQIITKYKMYVIVIKLTHIIDTHKISSISLFLSIHFKERKKSTVKTPTNLLVSLNQDFPIFN